MMENAAAYHYGNQQAFNPQQWYYDYNRQQTLATPPQSEYNKQYQYNNHYGMDSKTFNYNNPYEGLNSFPEPCEDVKHFSSCMENRPNDYYSHQKEKSSYDNNFFISNNNKFQNFAEYPRVTPKEPSKEEIIEGSEKKLKTILSNMNEILKNDKKVPKGSGYESLFAGIESSKEPVIKEEPINTFCESFNNNEATNSSIPELNVNMDKDDAASSSPNSFSSPQIYPWMTGGIGIVILQLFNVADVELC